MNITTPNPRFIIIMGVSGCGKTTVGQSLAAALGWDFFDGDDFHPQANVVKMSQGIPLTDTDRSYWLDTLQELIAKYQVENIPGILACSALKQEYRERLRRGNPTLTFVYLRGDYDLIQSRMQQRKEHYMKTALLQSQFDTLEEPNDALVIDIDLDVPEIVQYIIENLDIT